MHGFRPSKADAIRHCFHSINSFDVTVYKRIVAHWTTRGLRKGHIAVDDGLAMRIRSFHKDYRHSFGPNVAILTTALIKYRAATLPRVENPANRDIILAKPAHPEAGAEKYLRRLDTGDNSPT